MFKLVKTNGFYNIFDKTHQQFFHSFYNPEREVKLKLEKLNCKENDFLVILGNGFGYLMESAFYNYGVKEFLIVEPIDNLINYSILRPVIRKIINNSDTTVFFLTPENYDKTILRNLLLLEGGKDIKIIESGYFTKINNGFKRKILKDIRITVYELQKTLKNLESLDIDRNSHFKILKTILLSPTRGEIGI